MGVHNQDCSRISAVIQLDYLHRLNNHNSSLDKPNLKLLLNQISLKRSNQLLRLALFLVIYNLQAKAIQTIQHNRRVACLAAAIRGLDCLAN